MSEMIVKQSTSSIANLGAGPSVLGEKNASIPVGGKIRSGIQVLTPTGAGMPDAVEIYNRGVSKGVSFKAIGSALYKKFNKTLLMPKNVPYFTVRQEDFTIPGAAKFIMDNYATDGAEGYQLYGFPVIFPLDNWQAIMPHEFACYTAGEKKYWSEYDAAGNRLCMTHIPIEVINGVAHRPAAGRQHIPRPDIADGICNPDCCPEYQSRACKLSGRFLFYIPGLAGAKAISLGTNSIYSMMNARQQLEMVAFITGGKISGTHNGQPLFWISKRREPVSHIDPKTGKAKKVDQYLISLDANIDMTGLYQRSEAANMLAAGERAAEALGYVPPDDIDDIDTIEHITDSETLSDPVPVDGAPVVAESLLLEKIENATTYDDLVVVADLLSEIHDREAVKRLRSAMAAQYENIGGQS